MPPARACKIRAVHTQGGAIRADLNRETQLHGLAVTGGVVSTTGVAGLTLGGGLGWLMSKYGLALGNLLSVELVTADGKVRQVSVEEEPDLFWAVRGGGGNFRVATSFEFQRVQGLISAAGNPDRGRTRLSALGSRSPWGIAGWPALWWHALHEAVRSA
jgi:hypothetical protein